MAVTLLFAVPSIAVFNEKNISQTIAVLRSELHQENQKMENAKSMLSKKVAKLKTDNFRKRKSTVILLFGVVLFAISIMAAGNFIGQNFFKVASGALLVYAWLLGGILLSLLIRIPAEKLKVSTSVYTPTVLLGLVVIVFRIIFIPNRLLNLIYPPLLLAFTIWQICISSKSRKKIEKTDFLLATISIVILGMTTISAWAGHVLLSVQLFLWWLFQLAAIESITALSILILSTSFIGLLIYYFILRSLIK